MKLLFTYRIGRILFCQCCVLTRAHLSCLKQGWKQRDTLWKDSLYSTKKITLVMNKQWWNVYFFGVSRPSLGVPWENRGRRATPNSIVSLWTVSRNCCMERCALYSEGVGLHRDRFQSLRLLKISGSWRPSVTREHFTQEWVREEWGHSESWGSPTGHETETQIITEKWARVCADCLRGNPLPWIECFSWNHLAPGGSLLETRLEGAHPFGPLELAESDVWICHSPLLYKVWARLLAGLCWPDWGGWICWAPFPAPAPSCGGSGAPARAAFRAVNCSG